MRFLNKNIFSKIISYELIKYPTYPNLSYLWNFGFLSFFFLFLQIITGIFLAMYYISGSSNAFLSIEHIMRDINFGWLIRYCHSNGASFFFLCVYLHIFRNIYYNTFIKPREFVWFIGVLIFLCMIITAFLGYVLPWGQMSFWAATVITNLFSAIPLLGSIIVIWLWGGFSVDSATLTKFFSLHYLLPFVIFLLVIAHILILHRYGSSNPLGIYIVKDKILFYPYYIFKDLFSLLIILNIFFYFVFFNPNFLGHPDNYIMANMLVTPQHIVPEWYLLVFYAILRSIPNKLGGIVILFLVIIFLFILPFLTWGLNRSSWFLNFFKFNFWFFITICLLLEWIGQQPMEYPFLQIGQLCTIIYILFFIQFFNLTDYISYFVFKNYNMGDFFIFKQLLV
jgi:quinol-cytochrome oxidoreductase complex cytochrome b subunit